MILEPKFQLQFSMAVKNGQCIRIQKKIKPVSKQQNKKTEPVREHSFCAVAICMTMQKLVSCKFM